MKKKSKLKKSKLKKKSELKKKQKAKQSPQRFEPGENGIGDSRLIQ